MKKNKWLYILITTFAVVVGCSKEEAPKKDSPIEEDVPKTFMEARKRGMMDVKYNAELEKLRKENASPVIEIKKTLAAKNAALEAAKSSNAPKETIEALEKECKELRISAYKAEKEYTRKMLKIVQTKMMEEYESVKKNNGAKSN